MDTVARRVLKLAVADFEQYKNPPKAVVLRAFGYYSEVKFKGGHPVYLTVREDAGKISRIWGFNEEKIQGLLTEGRSE
ncbi:MAG: hypothetical protein J7L26_03455 [Candidatus Aminicenantes bacterium]|nr:hypothetical protein [Candidatus Aminicenantes bacterium]